MKMSVQQRKISIITSSNQFFQYMSNKLKLGIRQRVEYLGNFTKLV